MLGKFILGVLLLTPYYLMAADLTLNKPIYITSFDFNTDHNQICNDKDWLSIDELISYGLSHGFETREEAQRLYQARHVVGEKLGLLFPSLNFRSIVVASEKSFTEVASSFIGFIFPSHWFQWKESKHLALAEKESYKTLLANRLNEIQNLYHNIHLMIVQKDIFSFYHSKMKEIINNIIYQKDHLHRPIDPEQLGIIYTIRAQLAHSKKKLSFDLNNIYHQLGFAVAYKKNWEKIKLKRLLFKDISELEKLVISQKTLTKIYKKSTELKTIAHLKEAARYAKKSKYFDFISPHGNNNLGVGSVHSIKIAKSKIHLLEIQKEKTLANLKLSTYNAIYKFNESIKLYRNSIKMQVAMEGPMQSLIDNVLNLEEFFDIEKAIRFFDYSLRADTATNLNWHLNLIAKNHMDRLLWKGSKIKQVDFLALQKKH